MRCTCHRMLFFNLFFQQWRLGLKWSTTRSCTKNARLPARTLTQPISLPCRCVCVCEWYVCVFSASARTLVTLVTWRHALVFVWRRAGACACTCAWVCFSTSLSRSLSLSLSCVFCVTCMVCRDRTQERRKVPTSPLPKPANAFTSTSPITIEPDTLSPIQWGLYTEASHYTFLEYGRLYFLCKHTHTHKHQLVRFCSMFRSVHIISVVKNQETRVTVAQQFLGTPHARYRGTRRM